MRMIFASVLLALAVSVPSAMACSCLGPETIEAEVAEVEIAFVGVALDSVAEPARRGGSPALTRFRVSEVFRGPVPDEVALVHETNTARCGVRFAAGEAVLVFAWERPDGRLGTALCAMPNRREIAPYREAFAAAGP